MATLDSGARPEFRRDFGLSPQKHVEVAAMVMPKRMTGMKHMLRHACKFLPMPLSLGWEDSPVDDDYPQRLLVPGLQLTDIESGATRTVTAPWMHALYSMTLENQQSGVTEIKLEDAHFSTSFTWQHRAVLGVLCLQGIVSLRAYVRHQRREGIIILLGIALQILEGYYAWKYPTHMPPRPVEKARYYALHKGMTSTHFLLISHRPTSIPPNVKKPFTNLEDAAVPLRIVRKGYHRIQEAYLRKLLQVASITLKLGAILSFSSSLVIPFTLLIGTITSEIITSFHTPLPRYSEMEPLDAANPKHANILNMLTAIGQRTGSISMGLMGSALPDPVGNRVDYHWIAKILRSKGALLSGFHPRREIANALLAAALRRITHSRP